MIRMMWYTRRGILKYNEDTKKEEGSNDSSVEVMKSDPGPKRKTETLVVNERSSTSVPREW